MSQVKNIIAFLMIVLLGIPAAGPALAAPGTYIGHLQIPPPVADDAYGGQMILPATELPDLPDGISARDPGSGLSNPSTGFQLEPIASGEGELLESTGEYDQFSIFDLEPALLESTGTWLRRGFWFSEVDAVILNREINKRNHFPLIRQTTGATTDQFGRFKNVDNILAVAGNKPSVETMPRIKIGRFLFRDEKNRDHTVEFTWFGGGQWAQDGELNAVTSGSNTGTSSLEVPLNVDGGNPSFDGATSSRFSYGSRFNSFELNYQVKGRLHRDQMIMKPDGEWVRAANPTITRTFLTGLRYFEMNELLDWNAFDVPDLVTGGGATVDGNYRVHTENDLFGMQVGGSMSYETSRWSFGILGKSGIYLDQMFLQSGFNNTNRLTSGGTDTHNDAVSWLSELRLQGKWHLRPNFSFRAGTELLYVKSVALAPYQVNFVPGNYPDITTTVSPTATSEQYSLYLGFSAGFEGYW